MTNFTYSDKSTENYISMSISGQTCWITQYYVDPDNGKLFVVLFKEAIKDMKKKDCDTFTQYVSESDWNNFLKSNNVWKKINNFDGIVHISCSIDDAVKCVIAGFGLTY